MRNLLSFLILAFLFVGCATDQKEQFEKVKIGMEKNDVLGILDSPQRTQRWHGMDRWTYIFYEENMRHEKEVHFLEGKAKYVGDVYKPEVSAEQQDEINEVSNREAESQLQAKRDETKKAFSDYELKSRDESTIRYVPQFVPVQ